MKTELTTAQTSSHNDVRPRSARAAPSPKDRALHPLTGRLDYGILSAVPTCESFHPARYAGRFFDVGQWGIRYLLRQPCRSFL